MKILHRCCSRTGDRLRKFGLRKETAVLLCPQGFLHRPGHDHEDEDHDDDHDDDHQGDHSGPQGFLYRPGHDHHDDDRDDHGTLTMMFHKVSS